MSVLMRAFPSRAAVGWPVALTMVALLAGSVGCASDAEPAPPSDGLEDGAFDAVDGMADADGRQPVTAEDRNVIAAAETRLIAACMSDAGFSYEVRTADDYVTPPPPYLSPSELRRSGYQYDWAAAAESFLETNGPSGAPDPTAGMTPDEAEAYTWALLGPPTAPRAALDEPGGGSVFASTEGCVAGARTELYGSVANSLRFERAVQYLSHSGVADELRRRDDYRTAMHDWQQCMRGFGHDVDDNTDYGASWLQRRGADALATGGIGQTTITAEVIESVATADAECQESSGFFEVRETLLPAARDAIATELGFEMTQYNAFQHAVLDAAERVP